MGVEVQQHEEVNIRRAQAHGAPKGKDRLETSAEGSLLWLCDNASAKVGHLRAPCRTGLHSDSRVCVMVGGRRVTGSTHAKLAHKRRCE